MFKLKIDYKSFYITSILNKHYFSDINAINLSISEGLNNKNRLVLVSSNFKKFTPNITSLSSNLISVIQEFNRFINIKIYSYKTKKKQYNNYSTLPN
jgi:hypothetical protein